MSIDPAELFEPCIARLQRLEQNRQVKRFRLDRRAVVPFTQIQYSQTAFLNFNGLTWPHVSVATLIPAGPIVVPGLLLS